MATGSLLALLDDIATILDDVALMTKVAAKKSAAMADDVSVMTKVAAQKTAGVLGDGAANRQKLSPLRPIFAFDAPSQTASWNRRSHARQGAAGTPPALSFTPTHTWRRCWR